MKVLSMIQPWATLLVHRVTQHETRSWRTRYRGPFAIHASQTIDRKACREEIVQGLLHELGYSAKTLPTGVIMASCRIVDCVKIIDNNGAFAVIEDGRTIAGIDSQIGGYVPGHYMWEIRDMTILPEPIPAKGKLGFWDYFPSE
ncbi:ASCH domain-containing protein [Paenibacillus sp. TRM 82003]|nr:ASCH domain-containing protein [Paenibacillus sp. TRM 82003]